MQSETYNLNSSKTNAFSEQGNMSGEKNSKFAIGGVKKAVKKLERKIAHYESRSPQFYKTVNGVSVPQPRENDDKIAQLNEQKRVREKELRDLQSAATTSNRED